METAFVWLLGLAADAPFTSWLELTGDNLLNSGPGSLEKSFVSPRSWVSLPGRSTEECQSSLLLGVLQNLKRTHRF